MSIGNITAYVESGHAADHKKTTKSQQEELHVVKGAEKVSGDLGCAQGIPGSVADVKARTSFVKLLQADGHRMTQAGDYKKCLCPFHCEKTPSFFVYPNGTDATCFGCGWKGDIFDYVMKRDGVSFSRALKTLKTSSHARIPARPKSQNKIRSEHDPLTGDQRQIMTAAAACVAETEWLQERIASPRKWNPNTIQILSQQGYLGWYRGALAFIYPNGLKLRKWPYKDFSWEFGHQHLWRGDRIKSAQNILLTEGETDAITLIDMGVEKADEVAVVCMPGASSFQEEWAKLFSGKTVTMCFDSDEAGQAATTRVAALLHPYAAEIRVVNPGEVGNE